MDVLSCACVLHFCPGACFLSEGCHGGAPLEDMIRLANQVGVEPWFSVPYNADDNYITNMANLIHDQLRPDLVRAGRLFSVCGCSLWVAVCVCVLVVGILIGRTSTN
jgi:hypothetical protein